MELEPGLEKNTPTQERVDSQVGARLLPDGIIPNVKIIDPPSEAEIAELREEARVQDPLGAEGHVGGMHFSGGKEGGKRRRTPRG